MPTKSKPLSDFETFVNMTFPTNFLWGREGVIPEVLLRLGGEELARAKAMILEALPAAEIPQPFDAAAILGLAEAIPLARQRLAETANDVDAQSVAISAATTLYRLGETDEGERGLLQAMRLVSSDAHNSHARYPELAWIDLRVGLGYFQLSQKLLVALVELIADESYPGRVDAEFAHLGAPPMRERARLTLRSLLTGHQPGAIVALERIQEPAFRPGFVRYLEGQAATPAGRAVLAALPEAERARLREMLLHRLNAHEDNNAILVVGLLGGVEAREKQEEIVGRQHGEFDAARAAVALQYIHDDDAFQLVLETIRAGRGQYDRDQTISLLAHLPLTRERLGALLLSLPDIPDNLTRVLLLDWIGQRYATTAEAQALYATIKDASINKAVWNDAKGAYDFIDGQVPDEAALRTLLEMLSGF